MDQSFYDFSAKSLSGQDVSLSNFAGKVVLVVNTASKCGFTPQYAGLEKLYRALGPAKFVVLGFPCNQFGNQEPGGPDEINQCLVNYGVSFPIFAKIEVNGSNTHPLFAWLKDQLSGMGGKAIKWNFTKFLVGKDGEPIKRFAPATSPESIADSVREAIDM